MIEMGRDLSMPHPLRQIDELSLCLNVFRPSHRAVLAKALKSRGEAEEAAMRAIQLYVEGWGEASWLEEYSIERIGRWLRSEATPEFRARLIEWASTTQASEAQKKARRALLAGMQSMTEARS